MNCPDTHKHQQTTTCYHDHGCRCDPCRSHMTARTRERYRLRAYGRYEGRVSPRSTMRRYQGLQVLGWRAEDIAQRAGYSAPEPLLRLVKHKYITPETRDRIARACDELIREGRGPSEVTANRALRKGWVSVFAWDDIENDDAPVTAPKRVRGIDQIAVDITMAGERVRLTREDKLAALTRMRENGWGRWRICETLRINTVTLDQMLKEVA